MVAGGLKVGSRVAVARLGGREDFWRSRAGLPPRFHEDGRRKPLDRDLQVPLLKEYAKERA
jgi:hypothetical protein